jgi:hypothetical protein
MKRVVCTRCGCKDAADFVLRILCPEQGCTNYDKKLADERHQEDIDELELDFIADSGGSCYLPDLDIDALLADVDLSLDDDDDTK